VSVRAIVRLGHPALRTPAEAVPSEEIAGEGIQGLVDEMIGSMRGAGGVGLAAPQLGVGRQIFVFEASPESLEPVGVVINPLVEPHPGEMVYGWEGCLSIPDLIGLVPRHPAIRLLGLDRQGQEIDLELEGFAARVAQHEYDHLHGVVFLDRMRDLRSLAFVQEWERYLADGERTAVG
jgi:peptide deformylase